MWSAGRAAISSNSPSKGGCARPTGGQPGEEFPETSENRKKPKEIAGREAHCAHGENYPEEKLNSIVYVWAA